MVKNRKNVPGNRTLMPIVVEILQKNGGTLSNTQVVYMVMFKHDLPQKLFKKAYTEVGFSGVYLRKIGALKPDTKKGIWTLEDEYMSMDFEQIKKATYEKYDTLLNRD